VIRHFLANVVEGSTLVPSSFAIQLLFPPLVIRLSSLGLVELVYSASQDSQCSRSILALVTLVDHDRDAGWLVNHSNRTGNFVPVLAAGPRATHSCPADIPYVQSRDVGHNRQDGNPHDAGVAPPVSLPRRNPLNHMLAAFVVESRLDGFAFEPEGDAGFGRAEDLFFEA